MSIDVNPDTDELDALHDELKAYEQQLASYLNSQQGQADPDYTALAKADIALNMQIYNLSNTALQLAANNAGAAVDAINAGVGALNAVIARKAKIATDLKVVQAAVSFVTALVSVNPSQIISTGSALVSTLKGN